jgi:hypothetical protein
MRGFFICILNYKNLKSIALNLFKQCSLMCVGYIEEFRLHTSSLLFLKENGPILEGLRTKSQQH